MSTASSVFLNHVLASRRAQQAAFQSKDWKAIDAIQSNAERMNPVRPTIAKTTLGAKRIVPALLSPVLSRSVVC